jgi:hypothetical protein
MSPIMSTPTIAELKRAIKLKTKLEAIQSELEGLLGLRSSDGRTPSRKVSASGRARMAAAQKARWTKKKGKKGRRKMSASGRAKIAAAARARWKAAKAAGRSRL